MKTVRFGRFSPFLTPMINEAFNERSVRIAALQFAPALGEVGANIAAVQRLAEGCRCDLLVLPELALTGYFFTERSELLELAEDPETGAFCGWVRDHAARNGRVVVAGFAERSGDRCYNSALTALPDGTYRVYRKTHLFYREHAVFEPGDTGFFVVEWEGIRYGTMICYDWRFPEAGRALALRGADIIAHPSNLVAAAALWGPVMAVRALENKVIAVTANRFGVEEREGETLRFSGESRIIDMNGATLALAGPEEECVIEADTFPLKTRNKSFNAFNNILSDRRPEMYE